MQDAGANFEVTVTNVNMIGILAADHIITRVRNFNPTDAKRFSLGLATGNSPITTYSEIIRRQREFPSGRIVTHNLDEYVGLPGDTVLARASHPESYETFMKVNFFDGLRQKFASTNIPAGTSADQERLEELLARYKQDTSAYTILGESSGKAIVIPETSKNAYLRWIKENVLQSYLRSLDKAGGIDLQLVGVGGRGHIGFHESGIPLELRMLLVQLDENTIRNAISDGHFKSEEESPHYAVSIGAGYLFDPACTREILLLAAGKRKAEPIHASLMGELTSAVPISGLPRYAETRRVRYILDEQAASGILCHEKALADKGIRLSYAK